MSSLPQLAAHVFVVGFDKQQAKSPRICAGFLWFRRASPATYRMVVVVMPERMLVIGITSFFPGRSLVLDERHEG